MRPDLIRFGGLRVQLGLLGESFQSFFAERLLVQEEFGGADSGSAVKPALNNVVLRQVGQREQTHPLMMGHPGTD